MNTRGRVFNGTKVFICLRTDIFGVEDEHVTMEYLGAFPTWDHLLNRCNYWDNMFGGSFPVEVNGFANWKNDLYYKVALIKFPTMPKINFLKNWHITLQKSAKPFDSMPVFTEEILKDECFSLWVGYSDKDGNKCWISHRDISKRLIPALAIPSR